MLILSWARGASPRSFARSLVVHSRNRAWRNAVDSTIQLFVQFLQIQQGVTFNVIHDGVGIICLCCMQNTCGKNVMCDCKRKLATERFLRINDNDLTNEEREENLTRKWWSARRAQEGENLGMCEDKYIYIWIICVWKARTKSGCKQNVNASLWTLLHLPFLAIFILVWSLEF